MPENLGSTLAGLVGVVTLVVLAFQVGQCSAPAQSRGSLQTDTVYVERTLVKRDTVTRSVPRERIVYRTVRDTVTRIVSVPVGLQDTRISVIAPDPVAIDGGEVTLSRYDPTDDRWVQDVYRVEPERWALGPYASAQVLPGTAVASAGIRMRWHRVQASAGYAVSDVGAGVTVGASLYPFTIRW